MKLRRQLLLVSLVMLSLPWAGCQYIQQMEKALRDGQSKALAATARAVAARMASEAEGIDLPPHPAVYNARQQFYLHPLRRAAIVDGYGAEWAALDRVPARYLDGGNGSIAADVFGGWHDNSIYLYFEIRDPSQDYYNPQAGGLSNGDHLVLRTLPAAHQMREYLFRAGGSGRITARYLNDYDAVRQEHRIRGEWRDTTDGYAVEIELPRHLAGSGLDFYYQNADDEDSRLGNYNSIDYPAPWVRPRPELARALKPYAEEGQRITVANVHGWLLAAAGDLDHRRPEAGSGPVLTALYRLALGRESFAALVDPRRSGHVGGPEIGAALAGDIGAGWYQNGAQRVGRVAVPVSGRGRILGAVVVEQSTDSLLAETNAAFGQLLFYTLLATGCAGFGLLAYASWLSWRIRRLKRAADTAIGDDGRIRPELLRSRAGDEIGDLTRSYGELLQRLRDYTDYLRSLSSKLSHELRTPLAVMKSSLDNLRQDRDGDNAEVYVQRARDASQRLSTILNAMSSATRMEESIQQAQREQFPLDELLRELASAYRATYPANFRLEIGPGDYRFEGSPDLIVQMLDKLVDNALDFCPEGGVITLALRRDRSQFELSVSNTGPLLPEHMQGQLFDSLVSLREGRTADDKAHLGLGLYIVRLIADFHRGRVSAANSADGSGVVFRIQLPTGSPTKKPR